MCDLVHTTQYIKTRKDAKGRVERGREIESFVSLHIS